MAATEQAVKAHGQCTNCASACTFWLVQVHKGKHIKWEVEYACNSCGLISHDGDRGWAPDYVRKHLIDEYGTSKVCSAAREVSSRVESLRAFRKAFTFSVQQAKAASQDLFSTGWCGTQIECELIAEFLLAEGLQAEVTKGRE